MTSPEQYDAIIIGAGQAGPPLATTLAGAGWKTAIIEREHVGGTCINEGCTPTKTMIASGRAAFMARRAATYGVQTGAVTVDMQTVRQRKRDIVESWRGGSEQRLHGKEHLHLLMGEASFTAPGTVAVQMNDGSHRVLTADKIFVNTGARPFYPPIPGLQDAPTLNSTTIMELDSVPEHLLVLGGGYIGLEFGQLFHRLGSQVTIVQRNQQVAPREDADIAQAIVDILREDGIEVLTGTSTLGVQQSPDGAIQLNVKADDGGRMLSGSHLLVATGRRPNTDLLNVEAAGLESDKKGHLIVNERLETSVPGIYALGDVNGGPAFTHISYDDFRIIRTNLLEGGQATVRNRMVPYTIFIDPQLGRIGLTEQQARNRGYHVRVASMPMSYVARALEVEESRGMMKAVVDGDTDQILGAAVLGIEGGEVVGLLQVAMMGQVTASTLREAVFPHPTLSESMNTLFASFTS